MGCELTKSCSDQCSSPSLGGSARAQIFARERQKAVFRLAPENRAQAASLNEA